MSRLEFRSSAAETQHWIHWGRINTNASERWKTTLNILNDLNHICYGHSDILCIYISSLTVLIGLYSFSSSYLFRAGRCSLQVAFRRAEFWQTCSTPGGNKVVGKREDEWLIQQLGLKWDVVGLNITKTWVKFVNHTPTFFKCWKCESIFRLIFSLLTHPNSRQVLLVSAFTFAALSFTIWPSAHCM